MPIASDQPDAAASGPSDGGVVSDAPPWLVGTTPTQAVLQYTAPDGNPCTVAVSESPSLSPLVHDVDPSLFSGADRDDRPGTSRAAASVHIFVIGKRAAEVASDGKWYSRALQASTLHYVRVTCAGTVVIDDTFTTANVSRGMTYNDPLPVDRAHPGSYAWPTIDIADRNAVVVDPQTGILLRPFTTTQDGASFGWTASGGGSFCSGTPVSTPNGAMGSFCYFSGNLWFIESATGQVSNLGVPNTWGYNLGWGLNEPCYSVAFDPVHPSTLLCVAGASPNNYLVSVEYVGDYTSSSGNLPLCSGGNKPCVNSKQLAGGSSLLSWLNSYDATANPSYCDVKGVDGSKIYVACTRSNQDSYGWVFVYDLAQSKVVAELNTLTGNGVPRWCAWHGGGQSAAPGWIDITSNDLTHDNGLAGFGPYVAHITSGALTTAVGPCPASAGVSGNACSTATLDGDPVESPSHDGDIQSQPLVVGDFVSIDANTDNHEIMRVVDTNGTTLTFLRGWDIGQRAATAGAVRDHSGSNGVINPVCGATYSGGNYHWNFAADPFEANPAASVVIEPYGSNHGSAGPNVLLHSVAPDGTSAYALWRGTFPDIWKTNVPTALVNNDPLFHGVPYAVGKPNSVDSHPGDMTADWFTDGRPLNNFTNSSDGQTHAADHLDGDLYHLTSNAYGGYGAAQFTHVQLDPKHSPVMAYCGVNVLSDVSGPSASIDGSAANAYRYCIAKTAGECHSGSVPGDIYLNCPNVQQPYCTFDGVAKNTPNLVDICIGNVGAYTNGIVQIADTASDPTGAAGRLLTHGLGRYHRQDVYWNTWIVPDMRWTMFDIPYPNGADNNGQVTSEQIWMAKLPPFPADDGIAKNDYVDISIPVQPPAGVVVDSATVEFGYAEYGDAGDFHCTTRNEACVAAGQPHEFAYASETTTGMSCSQGCTITVPALAMRTLYFRVQYRDATGAVIMTGPMQVVAVEPPFKIAG